MESLTEFLDREVKRTSYRDVEEFSGISRGSLENIIQRRNKKLPELETLIKVADKYNKPMWQVLEMAGIDLELPSSPDEHAQRLAGLVSRVPEFAPLLEALPRIRPQYAGAILVYLEALERSQGDPATREDNT